MCSAILIHGASWISMDPIIRLIEIHNIRIMLLHPQCMGIHNWIMEHHQPFIELHGTTMELHKSIIKFHKSCRIVELHRSCNRHKSFIEFHQLIVEISKSIIELHNYFRIMKLYISIVEIHHWVMDLHTSIINIQNWLMELHSLIYEDSQFDSWKFTVTKTGCQLQWQCARVVCGTLTSQSHIEVTISRVPNDKFCLKITFKVLQLSLWLGGVVMIKIFGKKTNFWWVTLYEAAQSQWYRKKHKKWPQKLTIHHWDTAILTHAILDLLYVTLYFFVAFWTGLIQKIGVCHIL